MEPKLADCEPHWEDPASVDFGVIDDKSRVEFLDDELFKYDQIAQNTYKVPRWV